MFWGIYSLLLKFFKIFGLGLPQVLVPGAQPWLSEPGSAIATLGLGAVQLFMCTPEEELAVKQNLLQHPVPGVGLTALCSGCSPPEGQVAKAGMSQALCSVLSSMCCCKGAQSAAADIPECPAP